MGVTASVQGANGITPEVLHSLRQMGRDFTQETIAAVTQLLTPLHEAAGYQAPHIVRDLAYGPDPRHPLDVHSDGSPSADRKPVLVFVHGGGFIAGRSFGWRCARRVLCRRSWWR